MVASQAVLAESAADIALEIAEHMESLAVAGDWEHVEDVTIRLRGAVMDVPEAERAAVLHAAQRSVQKVAAEAKKARQAITGEMHELRKGQAAKKAYELR